MDCPMCRKAMITMEMQGVEIDFCTECEGIWLDSGELELLLDDGGKSKELIDSFDKAEERGEKQKKCPICDRKMEKITVGQETSPLTIDRCSNGDGLWFDKGELKAIIEKAQLDKDNKIKQLLADMFGQKSGN